MEKGGTAMCCDSSEFKVSLVPEVGAEGKSTGKWFVECSVVILSLWGIGDFHLNAPG